MEIYDSPDKECEAEGKKIRKDFFIGAKGFNWERIVRELCKFVR